MQGGLNLKTVDIVDLLEKVGLTKLQAKVYLLLVRDPGLSVSELAREVKITRTTIYAVLNVLESKGLATSIDFGKSVLWYPIEFEAFFESYFVDLKYLEKAMSHFSFKQEVKCPFEILTGKYKNKLKLIQIIKKLKIKKIEILADNFHYYKNLFLNLPIEIFNLNEQYNLDELNNIQFIISREFVYLSFDNMNSGLLINEKKLINLAKVFLIKYQAQN